MSSQAAIVTVVCIMTCPSSKYDYCSVLLSCHCHRWLHHGQLPAPDKNVGLSFKLSLSQMVTSWPVPAPDECAALSPHVLTVTVGYIIASPSSIPVCWSVPLSCHCHSWLHNGQSQLQTRLLVCPPKLSLSQLVTSCTGLPQDTTVGLSP